MNNIKQKFKQQWKLIFNDPKTKPTFIMQTNYFWNNLTKKSESFLQKTKIKGQLNAKHFILYNILCNKPIHIGFVKESEQFKYAYEELKSIVSNNKYLSNSLNDFLIIFNTYFSEEDMQLIREKIINYFSVA